MQQGRSFARRRETAATAAQSPEPAAAQPQRGWALTGRLWHSVPAQWLLVVGLALLLRLWHLAEADQVPLFHMLVSDARSYADWAAQIVAGDLASSARGTFYQAPLYPYLLAAVLGAGGDFWTVRIVQAVAGALACGLVASSARLSFGTAAGWSAGLLLAIYAPAIFADGLIGKESVALLGMAVLLRLLVAVQRDSRGWHWWMLGITLGLLVLLRENFALLLPMLGGWLLLHWRGDSRRWRWLPALLAGTALVLLPVAARNWAVGGDFTLSTAQGGPNYYIGNHAGASGTYQPLRAGRSDTPFEQRDARELAQLASGRELRPGEVSSYWFGQSLAFIAAQPLDWLRLQLRKSWMLAHAYELPDAEDLYIYATPGRLLGALVWIGHWGVLLPLAVLGTVLSWPQRRQLWPVYLSVLLGLASVAAFFVLGRYRLPLLPMLAFLAGGGIGVLLQLRARGQLRRALPALVLALPVAILSNWPSPAWTDPGGMREVNLGVGMARQGRYPEAMAHYRTALRLQPQLPEAHLNLGNLLAVQGHMSEALRHLEFAVAAAPDDAEAALLLAHVLLLDPQRSAAQAQRALAMVQVLCPQARCRDQVGLPVLVLAYQANGRSTELKTVLQQARQLALQRGDPDTAAQLQAQLEQLP